MKKINLKVFSVLLVVLMLIPFATTFIDSEASDTRASVKENMAKYGFNADADKLEITLTKKIDVYINAGDANNRKNVAKTYPAGDYYIYKSVEGSLNISKSSNSAGAWVNARDLANSTPREIVPNAPQTKSDTYKLEKTTNIYSNASDAINEKNSKGTYGSGTYYIYKKYGKAINITKREGRPGAWIVPSVESNETKPNIVNNGSSQGNNTNSNKNIKQADIVNLENVSKVYRNASDARNERNYVTRYSSGKYYVYKISGNVANISKDKNSAGGWIKISELTLVENNSDNSSASQNQQGSSNKPANNNVARLEADQVRLPESTCVYMNASNAERGVNFIGVWKPAIYYVYKTYGNAVNITNKKGEPGAWVNKNNVEGLSDSTITTAPVKPNKPAEKEPDNKDAKVFNLVLDPGHGGGRKHNRGGLLFNEGDQNFKFTQAIMESAKRYKNISVTSTRKFINDDPSFEDRAKAGKGADLFVSIHSNASSPEVRGVEMWASNKNESDAFAKDITSTWSKEMDTLNRGVKYDQPKKSFTRKPVKDNEDTWFIFKGNEAKEKYLLESAFHTNMDDSKAYLEKQQELADKFMDIVAKHFNLKLK